MKHFLQRKIINAYNIITRGFSDEELWALNETIAKFIIPRLKRLQEVKHGYPSNITQEEWDDILNKIIRAFEIVLIEDDFYGHGNVDEWQEHRKIYDKKKKEGLELFAKYFDNLWD